MNTTQVAREAKYDQAAAYFREERKRLSKMASAMRKRDWFTCPVNVNTLAQYLIRGESDYRRISNLVKWAIIDAQDYRAEFVCARCHELDGRN